MTELPDDVRLERMRKFSMSLDGQDPEMQQSINKFMKMDSEIERSNLPTREDVHFVAWLDFAGKSYFGDDANPFTDLSKSVAISFMAKNGLKSEQVVRILQKGLDLSEIQTAKEPQKTSILDRIRRKPEE